MLEITVHKIKGKCPVFKEGDRITIRNPNIVLEKTDALCTHALHTLLHYCIILEYDWCPLKLGLTTEKYPESAYVQCLDPGPPYTQGGTVMFRFRRIPDPDKD